MVIVRIDARRITDWDTFHDCFAEAFDFPEYYGRNLDAWVDCMGDVAGPGELVALQLDHAGDLRESFREGYDAIIECSAFVNWRLTSDGTPPVLALSFNV